MDPSVCLLTPCFKKHLPHFLLQRESIERCGITIPHVAVVDHDDVPLFRDAPFQKNLTVLSTRDVLSARVERKRLARYRRRRDPRRYLSGRHLHGWTVQQYIKLSAPAVTQADSIVCLDSDTIFVDRVTPADFADPATGRPVLYETADDVDVEMAEWLGRAMRFLGLKTAGQPVTRFTHSPVVLRRDLLLEMRPFIEKVHGCDWFTAMERTDLIMEYSLYGAYAKFVDHLARVVPTKPTMTLYYWWADEVARVAETLPGRLAAGRFKILAVQSNAGLDPASYRPALDRVWAAREAAAA